MSTRRFQRLEHEWRPLLRLAVPVVIAELGWIGLSAVDTAMLGHVGPVALGAMSVGRALFMLVAFFGLGVLLSLDTLVSQALGAGRRDDCRHSLVQALLLAAAMSLVLVPAVRVASRGFEAWGVEASLLGEARGYIDAVCWALPPLLLYFALRRYLQAIHVTRPVVFALVTANGVNAAGNWVLIHGKLGLPALGAAGAGIATAVAAGYMTAVLALAVVRIDGWSTLVRGTRWRPDPRRMALMLRLGVPAAGHVMLDVGAFAISTAFVARLDPVSVAAHQIALTTGGVTAMVPVGIGSAGAVRAGHGIGRRDPAQVFAAGWATLALAVGFMACSAAAFMLAPRWVLAIFGAGPEVAAVGIGLIRAVAVFQIFDGLQIAVAGVLRGIGDTRTPLAVNLVGYWLLGIPLGYVLCFPGGRGALGIWIGLTAGLTAVGATLAAIWISRSRSLDTTLPAAADTAGV